MRFIFSIMIGTASLLSFAVAQTTPPPVRLDVFPPTPNAAAIQKFGDIPVNYSSGIPSISVPIHSYQGNNSLASKISIDYHAGGIRVEEVASDVGIGWSLNGVYTVSRTVRGLPDDLGQTGYFYVGSLQPPTHYYHPQGCNDDILQSSGLLCDSAVRFYKNIYDGQADLFSFTINGKSGKFIFGRNGDVVLIPQSKIKIKRILRQPATTFTNLLGFVITDTDGSEYQFMAADTVNSNRLSEITPAGVYYASSWGVTKYIAPFKTDSIQYTYTSSLISYSNINTQTVYVRNDIPSNTFPESLSEATFPHIIYNATVRRISRISYPDSTRLEFNYHSTPRKDVQCNGALNQILIYNRTRFIKGFRLNYSYGNNGNYEPAPSAVSSLLRLQLDSLNEYSQSQDLPPYRFTYNGTLPDRLSTAQDHWGFYYGPGRSNSNTLVPVHHVNALMTYEGADRTPDTTYCKTGVLTKIQYPTGGYTELEFEANRAGDNKLNYFYPATINVNGGAELVNNGYKIITVIRPYENNTNIKFNITQTTWCPGALNTCQFEYSIKSLFGNTVYGTATFAYADVGTTKSIYVNNLPNGNYRLTWQFNGAQVNCACTDLFSTTISWRQMQKDSTQLAGGIRVRKLINYDGIDHKNDFIKTFIYENQNGTSSGYVRIKPKYDFTYTLMQGVYVPQIPPYVGCNSIVKDYFVRTSSANSSPQIINGAPLIYARVEERMSDINAINTGKVVYTFSKFGFMGSGGAPCTDGNGGNCFPFPVLSTADYSLGLPLTTEYRNAGGNLDKKVSYEYSITEPAIYETSNYRSIKYGIVAYGNNFGATDCRSYFLSGVEFFPLTGRAEKIKETEINYSSAGDSIIKETRFTYDSSFYQLKTNRTTNSKGDTLEQRLYYPYNYTISGPIGILRDSGIIAPTISVENWKVAGSNKSFISGSIVDYASFSGILRPSIQYVSETSQLLPEATIGVFNPAVLNRNTTYFKQRNTYDFYDTKGNILQYGVNGDRTSILWDLNRQFPIAKVPNALQTQIAYTSFEADGTGNWTFTDTIRNRQFAFTGTQSYNLVTGKPITESVASGTQYILSYWSRSGSITVTANGAGITGTAGLTKSGFTYYEHILPNTTTSVSLAASNANIDELRLYPLTAQMETYTYLPSAGVNSTCGVNNITTYYEYDGFSRLNVVRDWDKNILKQMDYQYQAFTHCNPVWQNTSNIRCKVNGSSQNTGEQEREQKDINPCSPTYNTSQWVVIGTNLTACPLPNATVYSRNYALVSGFQATYTNTATNQSYTYPISGSAGIQTLGTIPAGVYNLTISKSTNTTTYYFTPGCGGLFAYGTSSVTFYNININSSSCTTLTIEVQ